MIQSSGGNWSPKVISYLVVEPQSICLHLGPKTVYPDIKFIPETNYNSPVVLE